MWSVLDSQFSLALSVTQMGTRAERFFSQNTLWAEQSASVAVAASAAVAAHVAVAADVAAHK